MSATVDDDAPESAEAETREIVRADTIELGDLDLGDGKPFTEGKGRPIEDTRARLAYALLALLALTLLLAFLLLGLGRIDTEGLVKIFSVTLAPMVGLVGAATGYYYGRSNR